MKCPRCGADNAERAERCYLCEYPFVADAMGEPPAPEEQVTPQYPPQSTQAGMVPPGPQAVPPPPPGAAHQAPPPGAYPPGYQPPPAAGTQQRLKIVIGILVAVLVIALGVGAYFIIRGKAYTVSLPVPPGYEEADEGLYEDAEKSMKSGGDDFTLDYLYINSSMTSFIFVVHQRFFLEETPPDDPDAAEEYYLEHKNEILADLNVGFTQENVSGDVSEYSVERITTGDAALRMKMSLTIAQARMDMDMLLVVKGKTMFMVIVQTFGSDASKTMEYIKENIRFE